MKFLKGASFWILLGLGVLAGLAYVVDTGFAMYFAPVVLGLFGLLALIAGIRAVLRGKKTERLVRYTRENLDASKDQQARWASAAKKRCSEVETACSKEYSGKANPVFQPEYEGEALIGQIMDTADRAKRTLAMLDAEIDRMKRGDAL